MRKLIRIAAIIFCMNILMTALAACGKEDSENSDPKSESEVTKPAEATAEPTKKETEEPTPEPTETPTPVPTDTPTPEPTQPPKDVVKYFYESHKVRDIAETSLAEFFHGGLYAYYCTSFITEKMHDNGLKMYTTKYGAPCKISDAPGEGSSTHDAEVYYYYTYKKNRNIDGLVFYYETEGKTGEIQCFVPVCFNETRGCFAGFQSNEERTEFSFVEMYYSPVAGGLALYPADWKDYDFPDHSGTQTNYYNNKVTIAITGGKVFTCEIADKEDWDILVAKMNNLTIGNVGSSRTEYAFALTDVSGLSQEQIDEKWAEATKLGEQDGWALYEIRKYGKTVPAAVKYIDGIEVCMTVRDRLEDLTKKLGLISNMSVQ